MLSNHPNCLGGNGPSASSDLIGDVDGPASATDNAVARFDGTTGKLIQNSVVTIADTTGAIAGATSLTAPASTDLTLAGGSSGASLVLGQGSSGAGTLSVTGTSGAGAGALALRTSFATTGSAARLALDNATYPNLGILEGGTENGSTSGYLALRTRSGGSTNEVLRATSAQNVLIGTTTDMSGSGGLKVAGTTASTGVGTGALQVSGGIYAGAASVFGDAVTVTGADKVLTITSTAATPGFTMRQTGGIAANRNWGIVTNNSVNGDFILRRSTTTSGDPVTPVLSFDSTGAATFAGAVSVNGTGTFGSSFGKVIINQWSDATNYGAITFNGNTTVAGSLGIGGGASGDSNLYLNAPTGGTIQLRINGTVAQTITSTGAATFAGAVTVSSTTAGSSGAGALVVAGGLATGAASYIGGTLTVSTGRINGTANGVGIMGAATSDTALTVYGTTSDSTKFALVAKDSGSNNLFLVRNDGAATFAGAVTAAVVTSTGAGYTNSGFQITNTSASRTTGFFLTNAGVTTIRDVTGVFDLFTINTSGNAAFAGTVSPQQTGTPPTYVKGAIYFDTALNKLRVGGATGWETITSV